MRFQRLTRPFLLLLVIGTLMCAGVAVSTRSEASVSAGGPIAFASPSPTPRSREELPQDSDEVVKFDTNLTNIFFTAAYVAGCVGSALTSQASVSRILYAMGRDGVLPRKVFGHVSLRFGTPTFAVPTR